MMKSDAFRVLLKDPDVPDIESVNFVPPKEPVPPCSVVKEPVFVEVIPELAVTEPVNFVPPKEPVPPFSVVKEPVFVEVIPELAVTEPVNVVPPKEPFSLISLVKEPVPDFDIVALIFSSADPFLI